MRIEATPLSGVYVLTPHRFGDERGFFAEVWNVKTLASAGLTLPAFVQDNQAISAQPGTLRGLHFQAPPHAQGKLVRCGRGAIFDVAVDARKGSPTYGQWHAEEMTAENGRQLWVPSGFLHGYLTLRPDTEVLYKCTDYYAPEASGEVSWDSCGISWPWSGAPVLSGKDAAAPAFADWTSPFDWDPQGGAA